MKTIKSDAANYYVMNPNGQMIHRGTEKGCLEWCSKLRQQWISYGMTPPMYRVFYDTATEPSHTINS